MRRKGIAEGNYECIRRSIMTTNESTRAQIAALLTIAATQNVQLPDAVASDATLLAETIVRTYEHILKRLTSPEG
jgi:hypothetical protein